jgi:hypothetical protein
MTYSIVQPPFTLKCHEMPKQELQAYFSWFQNVLPQRIAELNKAVRSTPGFEAWEPNLTPKSLDLLGEWFIGQVATRPTTPEEIEELKSQLTFPIDIPEEELTNRTFSLAMDIGMYFGEVVRKNVARARWDQPLRNKKFVDYGQPVIVGHGSVPLNPVGVAISLAYGIADKEDGGRRLRELWTKPKAGRA